MLPPNKLENMIVNKIIISNGFKTLHKIPNTDPLYFAAKFFLTISSNKKRVLSLTKLIIFTLNPNFLKNFIIILKYIFSNIYYLIS